MQKLKHTILTLAVIYACKSELKAQYITSIGISNYGAVHSMHINPSFSAYGNHKWQVNLGGAWVNVNNNYLTLKLPFSAYKYITGVPAVYQTEHGNPMFDKNWLHENLNGRNKHVGVAADVYGPSASVRIKSWSVGIVTSSHATARISGMPQNLAHAIYKEFDSAQGAFNEFFTLAEGGTNKISKFAIVGTSRVAAGINVSKSVKLDWNSQLLVGVTVKRNWGLPGAYLYNSGMVMNAVNLDSMVVQPTNVLMVNYGDEVGKGWGTDIGATYVFNKRGTKRQGGYEKNQTKYFAKFGVSVMDIGRIHYQNASFERVYTNQPVGINVAELKASASGSTDYQTLVDSFLRTFATVEEYTGSYSVGLPTRLVLSADFQVKKNFYVAGVITQSLRKRLSQNARYQSALMVAPRWEYRFFEVSTPVLFQYDYRSVRAGLSLRFGPFYLGSNSIGTFLYTKSARDADIFAGIAFSDLSDFDLWKNLKHWKARRGKAYHGCFTNF